MAEARVLSLKSSKRGGSAVEDRVLRFVPLELLRSKVLGCRNFVSATEQGFWGVEALTVR